MHAENLAAAEKPPTCVVACQDRPTAQLSSDGGLRAESMVTTTRDGVS